MPYAPVRPIVAHCPVMSTVLSLMNRSRLIAARMPWTSSGWFTGWIRHCLIVIPTELSASTGLRQFTRLMFWIVT